MHWFFFFSPPSYKDVQCCYDYSGLAFSHILLEVDEEPQCSEVTEELFFLVPTVLLSKSSSERGDLAVAPTVWTGINQLTPTVLFINPVAVLSPGPRIFPLLGNLYRGIMAITLFLQHLLEHPLSFQTSAIQIKALAQLVLISLSMSPSLP